MSSDQSSASLQQQLSESQERQTRDWVSSETSAGTVVDRELIYWFAQRLIQRDGLKETLRPDFVDGFLDRHPDLAERLVAPPQPEPQPPKPEKTTPTRGLALLRELRERDRRVAMYGDSPPPERRHAPYPEGDIVHHLFNRYIVRHGDLVTKYTTYEYGFGPNDHPNEAQALRFVKEHTTIPVPSVISSDWDRITMEYVEGQTLKQAWPVLTPNERSQILTQLSDYIAQLRALPGIYLGLLDGQGVVVPSIFDRWGGPFRTLFELHDWLVRPPKRLHTQSMHWHEITAQLGGEYPIVFTHGDIAARNIMVRDGRIVALLDWEYAGWYPEYWDYVLTLRGLDNTDWGTLGRYAPSLFVNRYYLEYVLMSFIMTIS